MNDLTVTGGGSLEAIPVQVNALQAMQAAEVDIQISTAHRFPRSISKFLKSATDMVTVDRATAASCLYRRPVGKEGGKMKYAEGESIRMAEIVAASYQNLRIASIITEVNGREVKASAMCHDLENNVAIRSDTIESTLTKDGKPFSERMQLVVAKSAQSKAIRDAIFRVVPRALCNSIRQAAEETALGQNKSLAERRKGVVDWIKTLGINGQRVYDALGIEGIEELGRSALLELVGIRTAIESGDVTVNDAFPEPEKDLPATGGRKKFGLGKDKVEKPGKEAPVNEQVKDVTESEEVPDTEVEEEAATDGQGELDPDAEPANWDDDGPDPTSQSVSEQSSTESESNPNQSTSLTNVQDSGKKSSTAPGNQPTIKYTCTKCKGSNITVKTVRGKETPFCLTCISGKNVVENK
jgi:hypothetical protein